MHNNVGMCDVNGRNGAFFGSHLFTLSEKYFISEK